MEKKTYLKTDLIAELAEHVGISKRKTDLLLTKLALIAYREALTGFNVPGICRLDVVHRNERRARIPSSGEQILICAHDALRVRPLRKAKDAVSPRPHNFITVLTPSELPQQGEATMPTVNTTPPVENPEQLVSFRCPSCSQEIEAPNDMAGTQSECPTCGNEIEVPYISEPGTIWGRALTDAETAQAAVTPIMPTETTTSNEPTITEPGDAMKSRTIRIELPDDI